MPTHTCVSSVCCIHRHYHSCSLICMVPSTNLLSKKGQQFQRCQRQHLTAECCVQRCPRTSQLGRLPGRWCRVACTDETHQASPKPLEQSAQHFRQTIERPKLQPFVAPSSTRQQLLDLRQREPVQGGTLLIRPLSQNWLVPAAELLTTSFAEAMGYMPMYKAYLRRQILQYLESHMNVAPKAVILVAVLISDGQTPIPDAAARSSSFSTLALEDLAHPDDASPSSSRSEQTEPSECQSSMEADGASDVEQQRLSSDSEASTSGPDVKDEEERFGVLVGTAELSFSASVRTKFLTLNAPEDCGYLCNMAVAEDYQRRGFGMALLRALEHTSEIVRQPDIYLHLRFQDEPAAALYRRAGYREVKRDNFLMLLLGRDRRYLMYKRLQLPEPEPQDDDITLPTNTLPTNFELQA